jgi:hypothetical protein
MADRTNLGKHGWIPVTPTSYSWQYRAVSFADASVVRVTPAMEAGLTDHVWTIAELLGAG